MAAPHVDLKELDAQGFTIVRDLLPRIGPAYTTALRHAADSLLQARADADAEEAAAQRERAVHDIRGPQLYSGPQGRVLAGAVTERSLAVARRLSRCEEEPEQLQLVEQVLIKTSAVSRSGPVPVAGPTNMHLDWVFLPEHYHAVPRQQCQPNPAPHPPAPLDSATL